MKTKNIQQILGILCRPTCPAKKPLKENCEFFSTAKEALLASY
ncbi:Ada metal-binding domain-containing protein, partial [Listeria monocytogenes]